MSGVRVINNVINQLGSPSMYQSALASFPSAGNTGRLLVATDTFALYRDNGTTYDLIGGPGTGTITGSGTTGKLVKFTNAAIIGDSIMSESGTTITVSGTVAATTFSGAGTNLTGNGSSFTSGNSTRWNGQVYSVAGIVTRNNMMIYDASDSSWKSVGPSDVATFISGQSFNIIGSATVLATARTISLTGDVTATTAAFDGSANVSGVATIANNAVTYAKMQAVSTTSKLLGSSSTTTAVTEITIGSGLTLTGTTLTSSGGLSGLTTNYIQKATSSSSIGNSQIFDNGTVVQINGTIGLTDPKLQVVASATASNYALALGAASGSTQNFIGGVNSTSGLTTFKVTALGAVTGLSFATNAAPAGSALMADGSLLAVASGSYTPTASNLSNVSSVTLQPSGWMRVGNKVTMTGRITLLPSASSTCSLRIDLPVSSSFGNFYEAFGVITVDQASLQSAAGFIQAIAGTSLLYVQFQNIALTNVNITYSVTYTII